VATGPKKRKVDDDDDDAVHPLTQMWALTLREEREL
jgi:hypothetical protein